MKKIITLTLIIVLAVGLAGTFSVNYIFDKMIGNQILSQLDLESLQEGFIDSDIEIDLENEDQDIEDADQENKESSEERNNEKVENPNVDKDSEKTTEFTTGNLKEIQDQFSTIDKLKVMTTITNKLSMDEIKELSSLASGGVDKEELNKIKKELKEKLDAKDVEYLKQLYVKYDK